MLMELYYEHYRENCRGKYWEEDVKCIPYMLLIKDVGQRNRFKDFLKENGFSCVDWNGEYPGVLVNMELRRFGMISKACAHTCVDNRNYTVDEFMNEVFLPYNDGGRN